MSVINQNLLLTPEGYQISRSVRLRSSASAYFNRTPASAGNRKTWTWSGWVKRGALGVTCRIFAADDGSGSTDQDYNTLFFTSSGQIKFAGNLTDFRTTTAVYRDPSAWYHIVFVTDTTQATAANRFKLYVNGVEVTAFGTSNNPAQNTDLAINSNIGHYLGAIATGPSGSYFDGYLTEVNFIDGQALTPSSFGETDSITGVWKPKKYAGTYGTNGFYLNFSDNSAATAAAIGKDWSGNGNNWTPNSISVTAGVTYDSMLDVPTPYADGGNGRGNYAVMNPLNQSSVSATPTNGNLTVSQATNFGQVASSIGMSSGKWYYEHTITAVGGENTVGIGGTLYSNAIIGANSNQYGYYLNGNKYISGTTSAYGASFTTGDVIGVAYDADAGSLTFYKNGATQGVATTGITGTMFALACTRTAGGTNISDFNFGQRPFAYTPPTGFLALNTQNLPDATIKKGNAYFDVSLFTGNGGAQTITGLAFQPDFVWLKPRSTANSHGLYDSVRGATKYLSSNGTGAEATYANSLTSFNSDGYSIGSDVNITSATFVGWQWKKSASAGFDIVTWTGNSTAGRTISHSLGVTPKMIILKARTNANAWYVYHANSNATPQNYGLVLSGTNAATAYSWFMNNTAPTSSVFSVGADSANNASGQDYVAYLFAEVAGFSKFGSYTGNGSTDGPFVYCGFRPRFLLIKISSTTGSWTMVDTSRDTYNLSTKGLYADLSDAEDSSRAIDILSNGFKIRSATANNTSGATHIFAAFAENPTKYSLAR